MTPLLSVLIVDDDDGHATLARRNLARAGLTTDIVHLRDGQEALDYLHRRGQWVTRREHDEIALVLDLNMPRLGGMAVLERLKADKRWTHVPVFVLTTSDNPVEISKCYRLGASACMVKPVDFGAFSEMMQRFAAFLMIASLPGEAVPVQHEHRR